MTESAFADDRVLLKPVDAGDYGFIRHIETVGNRLATYRHRGFVQSPEEFVRRLWAGVFSQFLIVTVESGTPIGLVCGYSLDQRSQHAEIAVIAAPELGDSRALFFDGVALFFDYAFRELNLRKIYAHVMESNQTSLPSRWSSVVVEEGVLREHAFVGGRFEDVRVLAIWAAEWTSLRSDHSARQGAGMSMDDFVALIDEQLDLGVAGLPSARDARLVDDLGMDSLALTTLVMIVDELRGSELTEAMVASIETVGDAFHLATADLGQTLLSPQAGLVQR